MNVLKLKKFVINTLGMTVTSFMTALGYGVRSWYYWEYQDKIPLHAQMAIKNYFSSRRIEYNNG